jgi:S1-C subfamily serine protease
MTVRHLLPLALSVLLLLRPFARGGEQASLDAYGAIFESVESGVMVRDVRPQRFVGQLGLKSGDVIRTVNGNAVNSQDGFIRELRLKPEKLAIGIVRDGSTRKIEVMLYWPSSVKDARQQRSLDRSPPIIVQTK